MEYCVVPVSMQISIYDDGSMSSEYTYCKIPVMDIVGLLVSGFGVDVGSL